MSQIFYEIDLLFKYHNREFKQFKTNKNLFLQGNDKMFWLHILLFNVLKKVRSLINRIVIGKEMRGY